MRRSRNVIAIPPGETIKEQLVDRGMKQKEFAMRILNMRITLWQRRQELQ